VAPLVVPVAPTRHSRCPAVTAAPSATAVARPEEDLQRLALSIRTAVGIEALTWLVDTAGLDRPEAFALMKSSGLALLRATLADLP